MKYKCVLLTAIFAAVLSGCLGKSTLPGPDMTARPASDSSIPYPQAGTLTNVPSTSTPLPTPTSLPTSTPLPSPTITSTPPPTPVPTAPVGTYEDWISLFDYDSEASLEIEEVGVESRGSVTIRDITFASPLGKIEAYLVIPAAKGPHPGIVYMHWYDTEPEAQSDRTQFLDEAVQLAEQGVASLLMNDIFFRKGLRANPDEDRQLVIQQVVDLRRGLDLLISQAEVDPERIAYVGHDFGGMYGAVLAGVDQRVKTYVLMTAIPDFTDWFLLILGRKLSGYRVGLQPVAPAQYVKHAAPASIFFQFALGDRYVSKKVADQLFDAASQPKRVEWYTGGHALHKNDTATQDRLEWLRTELGLR